MRVGRPSRIASGSDRTMAMSSAELGNRHVAMVWKSQGMDAGVTNLYYLSRWTSRSNLENTQNERTKERKKEERRKTKEFISSQKFPQVP